jgi:protein-tyrosine phosphatase
MTSPTDSAAAKATWTVSSAPAQRVKLPGVPNFGKLNDNIWRSGQPTGEGYRLLASQGLKTVVNLREEYPQDKDLIPTGVQYIYIPIKDEHAPTQEQAQEFLSAASNPANWPLLVHCHAGEGRAGTMAALVRCTLDKWSDSAVMKETNRFISTHGLGLYKPQLASCQRRLIVSWEANATITQPSVQVANIAAVPSGGSTIGTTVSTPGVQAKGDSSVATNGAGAAH